jgi:hypothetical protein
VAINPLLHSNTWKTSCGSAVHSFFIPTPPSWVSGGLYYLGGGWGWTRACIAGIEARIRFSVRTIESTRWRPDLIDEGYKRSHWAIDCRETWKSVVIWALCWRRDCPHLWRRIQHPDNPFSYFGDCHGTCEAYIYQLWDIGIPFRTNAVNAAQIHSW